MSDRYVLTRYTNASPGGETVYDSGQSVEPPPFIPPVTPPVTPADVAMILTPPVGGTAQLQIYQQGITYCFPLPSLAKGSVNISAEGGVGTQAHIELGYSHIPGDWVSAKAKTWLSQAGFGGLPTVNRYYADQGGYVGLAWGGIPQGERWFCSFRMDKTGYLTVQIPQQ